MKAIAITRAAAEGSNIPFLTDIELPQPVAEGHDLLVEVKAISVNPVDTKVRAGFNADTPRVLGWDAVGVVKAVGSAVTLFAAGDEVWYAGALGRPGSNSEFQLVDERIVARKPRSLDNAAAAALPLTAITAWELLFHRLGVEEGGNAGGSAGRRRFDTDPARQQAHRYDGHWYRLASGKPEMGTGSGRASCYRSQQTARRRAGAD